jgi:hypothetical protein
MDAEQIAMLQSFSAGIDLSENGLAMDAIREVGPGSHFLGCDHTQRNYLKGFFIPQVADTNSFEQWEAEGSQTQEQRAARMAQARLAQYEPPPLDEGIDEALKDFMGSLSRDGMARCRRKPSSMAVQAAQTTVAAPAPSTLSSGIVKPVHTCRQFSCYAAVAEVACEGTRQSRKLNGTAVQDNSMTQTVSRLRRRHGAPELRGYRSRSAPRLSVHRSCHTRRGCAEQRRSVRAVRTRSHLE